MAGLRGAVYRAQAALLPDDPRVPLHPAQRLLGFAAFAYGRFLRARSLQVAGSLTCTTLLALVPVLTVALTVLTAFASFRQLLPRVREFLLGAVLPETASRIIAGYMTHFSANAAQLRLAGTLVLVVAAAMAMMTVDRAFADIWRVRARRPLLGRLLTYWVFLMLAPLAVGIALTLSVSLVKVWLGLATGLHWLPRTVLRLIPWFAITSVLIGVYRWLPHRHVPLRHAVAGGIGAGLAFEGMKGLLGWYVHHMPGYALVYGAFAAFPIFLLWIYLSWAVVLGGAVLTASLSHWHQDAWRVPREHPDQRFRDALQVLRYLMAAGDQEAPGRHLADLQRALGMGYEDLENVLEPLQAAGWVRFDPDGCWGAQPSAWRMPVGAVWMLFHHGPRPGAWWAGEADPVAAGLTALDAVIADLPRQGLALPVARLVRPA